MQDVGVRFYTFISTLFYILKSAAATSIPVVVLDRPNPLNGDVRAIGCAAPQDRDGDGLSNLDEFNYHTDPLNPDTDGDGIPDGAESGKVDRGETPKRLKNPAGVRVLAADAQRRVIRRPRGGRRCVRPAPAVSLPASHRRD